MEAEKVLEIALSAGKILVDNGAESYRVEETVERICKSYNFECECIAIGKGVFASVINENNQKITSFKKIGTTQVDLYRIERINSFSRDIQKKSISYKEAEKALKSIEEAPSFSFSVRLLGACMTSFIYSLFFNGTIYDAAVSAIISAIIYFMLEKIRSVGFFQFFQAFFSGFIIGSLSLIAQSIFPYINEGGVITGAIMILLPGVVLTNGIKDIIYGDFMSGIAKFCESMLVIIAVGAGIGAALALKAGGGL